MRGFPPASRFRRRLELLALEPRQVLSTFGLAVPSLTGLLGDPSPPLLQVQIDGAGTTVSASLPANLLTVSLGASVLPKTGLSAQVGGIVADSVAAPTGGLLAPVVGLLPGAQTSPADPGATQPAVSLGVSLFPQTGLSVQLGGTAASVAVPTGGLLAPVVGLLTGAQTSPADPGPILPPSPGPSAPGAQTSAAVALLPTQTAPLDSNLPSRLAMGTGGGGTQPAAAVPTTNASVALPAVEPLPSPDLAAPNGPLLTTGEQFLPGPGSSFLHRFLTAAAGRMADEPEAGLDGPTITAAAPAKPAATEEPAIEVASLPALRPVGLLSDFLPLGVGVVGDVVDSLDSLRRLAEQGEHTLYWLALSLAAAAVAGEVAYRQGQSAPEVPRPPDEFPGTAGWPVV
jgi:hypothetical protein